jgi:hypothetical protein
MNETIHYNKYPVNPVYPVKIINLQNKPKIFSRCSLWPRWQKIQNKAKKRNEPKIPLLNWATFLDSGLLSLVYFTKLTEGKSDIAMADKPKFRVGEASPLRYEKCKTKPILTNP